MLKFHIILNKILLGSTVIFITKKYYLFFKLNTYRVMMSHNSTDDF